MNRTPTSPILGSMNAVTQLRVLERIARIADERFGDDSSVSRFASALMGGEPVSRDDAWLVAELVMKQLGGERATDSPLVDECHGEWSDEMIEAAHGLLEMVAA